jgi:hypothetical protein
MMSALRKPVEAVDGGAEERIVLYGVAWEEYERMLEIMIRHHFQTEEARARFRAGRLLLLHQREADARENAD